MFLSVVLLALSVSGEEPPEDYSMCSGMRSSALLVYNQKAVPIVWNSTLVLDPNDPRPFAVCRRGNPEDCQEGLLKYDYGRMYDREYRRCSVLTENCSCFGYTFEYEQAHRGNLTYFKASEYPECAVIRPTGRIGKPTTLVLQYTLREKPERYLTLGGRVALDALYRSLPVSPLVDEDKFISHHAPDYCNSQNNISITVPVCRSVFQINIEEASDNDALTPIEAFSVQTLPVVLFIFISVATPYVANKV